MDITFKTEELRDECNTDKLAKKKWGAANAKKLRQRLDNMRSATCLFNLYSLPGKCHSLDQDRAGQYAVHLDGGWRLIFEPAHDPVPRNADDAVDPLKVTAVRIVAIKDYHD